MSFIVTIHNGGGSMAEGMQPQRAFGPFPTLFSARQFADSFYDTCAAADDWLGDEMLTCVTELELPAATGGEEAKQFLLDNDYIEDGDYTDTPPTTTRHVAQVIDPIKLMVELGLTDKDTL